MSAYMITLTAQAAAAVRAELERHYTAHKTPAHEQVDKMIEAMQRGLLRADTEITVKLTDPVDAIGAAMLIDQWISPNSNVDPQVHEFIQTLFETIGRMICDLEDQRAKVSS